MPRRASLIREGCNAMISNHADHGMGCSHPPTAPQRTKPTIAAIAKIEKDRKDRRRAMAAAKKERQKESHLLEKMGQPGDVDFQRMIRTFRENNGSRIEAHDVPGETKITICVRKRPVNAKETKKRDFDAVTCLNPTAIVHDCKLKVDGITKYLDSNAFRFDHVRNYISYEALAHVAECQSFDETSSNELVYMYTAQPLVKFVCEEGGRATVFAYGQTGSGKTYTMQGIQTQIAVDIFDQVHEAPMRQADLQIYLSFFEIYGGRCQDLLHRKRLTIREDGNGEVQVVDLEEVQVTNVSELLQLIQKGNALRTTHATEVNDVSSRSHCICQISLRDSDNASQLRGKLSLIDLAGSERGTDVKNHDRDRRMESSEINKSLLALKECFRALDSGGRGIHIPFRASKLTQVLKDSFTNSQARTVMIATVSPCQSSADHTINTLRYADRVKEKHVATNAFCSEETPAVDINDVVFESDTENVEDIPLEVSDDHVHLTDTETPTRKKSNHSGAPAPCQGTSDADGNRAEMDDEAVVDKNTNGVIQTLYQEQESVLNAHMNAIQESAELLTEEGALLADIQSANVAEREIVKYTTRLDEILLQKTNTIENLRERLEVFRRRFQTKL
uniref:Kinesin-like protein n=1 Tax=Albugo laibachii Nc14 TaxID=890382 RepID=F0VZD2_9STRA|nr:kinesinlike protein putative [Albugo laibachii Nc14]|eukprot:CCA14162.1 kinesinlike protein putative [Albugo laibachii Nc14]